jgi:hypothetical protein
VVRDAHVRSADVVTRRLTAGPAMPASLRRQFGASGAYLTQIKAPHSPRSQLRFACRQALRLRQMQLVEAIYVSGI